MTGSERFGKGAAVRLERLTKHYDAVPAIREVSLEVRAGEFFTLLGSSGSGKTTVLLAVAGFIPLSAGEVYIDDAPVTHLPPYRRAVGMVFQSYALFPHMTVAENISFPLRMRQAPRDAIERRVTWALDLIRLHGYEGRYPRQLSGGQQQRVALARALVFEPAVLLMDEPLGALDRKLRGEMQLEVLKIHQTLGLTVISVTHDQEEALAMSDRIAVMNAGRIEQIGTPQELYERPARQFVADFLGESNIFDATVQEIRADVVAVRARSGVVMLARPVAGLRGGQRVTVSVRPERIFLAEGATGADNVVDGVVKKAIYLGESSKYLVTLPGGESLTLRVQNRFGARLLEVGKPLLVGWSRDAVILHPAPEA
jgi:putative spermidine/putrescine transport system ATP-binding protein